MASPAGGTPSYGPAVGGGGGGKLGWVGDAVGVVTDGVGSTVAVAGCVGRGVDVAGGTGVGVLLAPNRGVEVAVALGD